MNFLYHITNLLSDFLFPKSRRSLELEALSTATLINILPPAENIKDKHTIAIFDYAYPLVKEMIWEVKYYGNIKIAEKLGEILHDHIQHELDDLALFEPGNWRTTQPILIPIPASEERRFKRGWNQSELLSEQVVKCAGEQKFKYQPKQLTKIHHTESQTKTKSRNERLLNLTNSMKISDGPSLAGACVIVLDDVTTSGATFSEARRALNDAGVKNILCVAVAH